MTSVLDDVPEKLGRGAHPPSSSASATSSFSSPQPPLSLRSPPFATPAAHTTPMPACLSLLDTKDTHNDNEIHDDELLHALTGDLQGLRELLADPESSSDTWSDRANVNPMPAMTDPIPFTHLNASLPEFRPKAAPEEFHLQEYYPQQYNYGSFEYDKFSKEDDGTVMGTVMSGVTQQRKEVSPAGLPFGVSSDSLPPWRGVDENAWPRFRVQQQTTLPFTAEGTPLYGGGYEEQRQAWEQTDQKDMQNSTVDYPPYENDFPIVTGDLQCNNRGHSHMRPVSGRPLGQGKGSSGGGTGGKGQRPFGKRGGQNGAKGKRGGNGGGEHRGKGMVGTQGQVHQNVNNLVNGVPKRRKEYDNERGW